MEQKQQENFYKLSDGHAEKVTDTLTWVMGWLQ